MIQTILNRISARLPIRPIYHEGGLYLKRYYIGTLFGYWRVYLHHFLLDDPDGLHNHPFKYSFSIILSGYYIEERRWGYNIIKWFNFIGGDTLHRVLLSNKVKGKYGINKKPCWSLFVHSPRVTDWAFVRPSTILKIQSTIWKNYEEVNQGKTPTPFSDWYKDAPTGAEWELQQQKKTYAESLIAKGYGYKYTPKD